MTNHDPNGWRNRCARCGRMYWAHWTGHTGRVTRYELDEETPHQCLPEEAPSHESV